MNLFVYGTLMDREIMQIVTGGLFSSAKATLQGYVRKQVVGEVYPAIDRRQGHDVVGILYYDLSESALKKLDCFEGDQYDRCGVSVSLQDSQLADAQAYVFTEKSRQRLSADDWDYRFFLKTGKPSFLAGYSGFRERK